MSNVEVWAVWPTIHISKTNLMIRIWQERGYKVAVLVNPPHDHMDFPEADRVIVQAAWRGFPVAANILCREAPGDVVAVVGDDVYPDPHATAQEIGEWFEEKFPDGNGVMQPTGDVFGWTHKCAVSPWIGRTFIQKAYTNRGPYWEGYFHYFSDQELQEYATEMGVFVQREDLTQFHDHWQRKENPKRPEHLMEAGTKHSVDKLLFDKRKKEGWPCQ